MDGADTRLQERVLRLRAYSPYGVSHCEWPRAIQGVQRLQSDSANAPVVLENVQEIAEKKMSDECKCGFDHWPLSCKDENTPDKRAARSFATAGSHAPLSGVWRCSGDIICCGTLRIAVLDIDTQPSDEFKARLGAWMCRTLNKAQGNQ